MPTMKPKRCEGCGALFDPKAGNQRYCGHTSEHGPLPAVAAFEELSKNHPPAPARRPDAQAHRCGRLSLTVSAVNL